MPLNRYGIETLNNPAGPSGGGSVTPGSITMTGPGIVGRVAGTSGAATTLGIPLGEVLTNGSAQVAQLGTGAFTSAGATNIDQWYQAVGSGATISAQQVSFKPGTYTSWPQMLTTAVGFNRTVTGAAVSYESIMIPGAATLAGNTWTLTVPWFITTAAKSFTLGVTVYQSFGTGGSPSPGITTTTAGIAVATGDGVGTVTFIIPALDGTQTYGSNGDDHTLIWFVLPTGAGTVQGGLVCQLDAGAVGLPWRYVNYADDLLRCMRYRQLAWGRCQSGVDFAPQFGVQMYGTPTLSIFNTLKTNGTVDLEDANANGFSLHQVTGSYYTGTILGDSSITP